jgi:hypothetical protein
MKYCREDMQIERVSTDTKRKKEESREGDVTEVGDEGSVCR